MPIRIAICGAEEAFDRIVNGLKKLLQEKGLPPGRVAIVNCNWLRRHEEPPLDYDAPQIKSIVDPEAARPDFALLGLPENSSAERTRSINSIAGLFAIAQQIL